MIHHISISAHHPRHVAEVLAEILSGQAFHFPPLAGGFIAVCNDSYRTAIEVYPFGTEMMPGEGSDAAIFAFEANPSGYSATHAAISVNLEAPEILNIAQRERWRAVICDRSGGFQVIEFWVENRLMLELLTPKMARDYLKSLSPKEWTDLLDAN